jgi:hypothetical protein
MFETAGIAKDNGMLVPADHFGSTSQSYVVYSRVFYNILR